MSTEISVPEKTNLIINDTPLKTEFVANALGNLKSRKVEFMVFDCRELTQGISSMIESFIQRETTSIGIIFPGQGGQRVKETLPESLFSMIGNKNIIYDIGITRTYLRNRPQLTNLRVPDSIAQKINSREMGMVMIIDDVIATGDTVTSVVSNIKGRVAYLQPEDQNYDPYRRFSYPKTNNAPTVPFMIFTWLKQKGANTGDLNCYASIIYSRRSGKVPLNSISTILNSNSKAVAVKTSYSKKYFGDPREFLTLLDELKQLA